MLVSPLLFCDFLFHIIVQTFLIVHRLFGLSCDHLSDAVRAMERPGELVEAYLDDGFCNLVGKQTVLAETSHVITLSPRTKTVVYRLATATLYCARHITFMSCVAQLHKSECPPGGGSCLGHFWSQASQKSLPSLPAASQAPAVRVAPGRLARFRGLAHHLCRRYRKSKPQSLLRLCAKGNAPCLPFRSAAPRLTPPTQGSERAHEGFLLTKASCDVCTHVAFGNAQQMTSRRSQPTC